MAQTDRKFTSDVSVFSVAGTTYLATLKNCRVQRQVEEKESRAAKDTVRLYEAGPEDVTVTASLAVEGNGVMLQHVGTHVTCIVQEHGTGQEYTLTNGLVTTGTHDFSENGPQTEEIVIRGGTLVKAAP